MPQDLPGLQEIGNVAAAILGVHRRMLSLLCGTLIIAGDRGGSSSSSSSIHSQSCVDNHVAEGTVGREREQMYLQNTGKQRS